MVPISWFGSSFRYSLTYKSRKPFVVSTYSTGENCPSKHTQMLCHVSSVRVSHTRCSKLQKVLATRKAFSFLTLLLSYIIILHFLTAKDESSPSKAQAFFWTLDGTSYSKISSLYCSHSEIVSFFSIFRHQIIGLDQATKTMRPIKKQQSRMNCWRKYSSIIRRSWWHIFLKAVMFSSEHSQVSFPLTVLQSKLPLSNSLYYLNVVGKEIPQNVQEPNCTYSYLKIR